VHDPTLHPLQATLVPCELYSREALKRRTNTHREGVKSLGGTMMMCILSFEQSHFVSGHVVPGEMLACRKFLVGKFESFEKHCMMDEVLLICRIGMVVLCQKAGWAAVRGKTTKLQEINIPASEPG